MISGVVRVYVVNTGDRSTLIASVLLCTYVARRTIGTEVAAAGAFPLLLPAGNSVHFDFSSERLSAFAREGRAGAPIWMSTHDTLGNEISVKVPQTYHDILIGVRQRPDALATATAAD